MRSTRVAFLAGALALAMLLLSGCGAKSPTPPPAQGSDPATAATGGTLTIGMGLMGISNLDPQKVDNVGTQSVARMISDPLVDWVDGKYVGLLAENWETSSDGLVYTFHLRSGVKFSNGNPLTAAVVKQNFDRVTDANKPLYPASFLANVKQLDVVDETTFKITLKNLDPDFLMNLVQVYMVDPKAVAEMGEDAFGQAPVGTGPFKLVKFIPDQEVAMVRNENYWGSKPKLDEIKVKAIPDPETMVTTLQSGSVDLITFVPAKDVKALTEAGFVSFPFRAVNEALVAINNNTVPKPLRQAICYSLDRETILQNAYHGLGTPALSIAPPDGWAYEPDNNGFTYNPEQAKQILDEAGYKDTNGDGIREKDGQPFSLDFPSRGTGEWIIATQMVQQMLKEVGIDSKVRTMEGNPYSTDVRTGKYDIGWWIDNLPAQPPIVVADLLSAAHWYVFQAKYPELDSYLEKGSSTSARYRRPIRSIDAEVMHLLLTASWPGNIRELRNTVEQLVVLADDDVIRADFLPPELLRHHGSQVAQTLASPAPEECGGPQRLDAAVQEAERQALLAALRTNHGNRAAAARQLGISRPTLYGKLKRLGME